MHVNHGIYDITPISAYRINFPKEPLLYTPATSVSLQHHLLYNWKIIIMTSKARTYEQQQQQEQQQLHYSATSVGLLHATTTEVTALLTLL